MSNNVFNTASLFTKRLTEVAVAAFNHDPYAYRRLAETAICDSHLTKDILKTLGEQNRGRFLREVGGIVRDIPDLADIGIEVLAYSDCDVAIHEIGFIGRTYSDVSLLAIDTLKSFRSSAAASVIAWIGADQRRFAKDAYAAIEDIKSSFEGEDRNRRSIGDSIDWLDACMQNRFKLANFIGYGRG